MSAKSGLSTKAAQSTVPGISATTDASSPLPKTLLAALTKASQVETLLLAMDFDGTLAPFHPQPNKARPLPQSWAALLALTHYPRTTVALVSGRSLESLREVTSDSVDLFDTALLGFASHGSENFGLEKLATNNLIPADHPQQVQLNPAQASAKAEVIHALELLSQKFTGTFLEIKPAGVVLHTRQAKAQVAENAQASALRILRKIAHAHLPNVDFSAGNQVIEVNFVKITKKDALLSLKKLSGADAIIFAGDDTTDENGFAALDQNRNDVGIKVDAEPGSTEPSSSADSLAMYRVSGCTGVGKVLEKINALRAAHCTKTRAVRGDQ